MSDKHQINFLRREFAEGAGLAKFLKWATTFGRWVVVLTDLVVISAFLSRFYFDTKLADLHELITQDQAIIESATPFEETFRLVQKKLGILKSLSLKKFATEDKASFISSILPQDVVLKNVYVSPQEINLSGSAGSDIGLGLLLRNLISSPKISKVNVSQLAFGERKEAGTISFTITATWKNL